MRALIVDDEARVRKAIRLLVDWQSHDIIEIEEAGSGHEAIKLIQKFKPELVIMDMMMDSGHGLELMAWVNEHAGSTKFIVVSGHDDFEFVRSTVRHGGIDYILKPIDPETINTAVAKAVKEWRLEEQHRMEQHVRSIQLNEIKPVYGEKLLSSLIDDPGSAESALRRLRSDGVVPQEVSSARLMLIQVDSGDASLLQRFKHDSELLLFALINICNEFLLADKRGIAFKYWGAPMEILIFLWKEPEQGTELISQINLGLYHTLQRKLHFGVASGGEIPNSLPIQYSEAAAAIRKRNLFHSNEFIHTLTSVTPWAGSSSPYTLFAKVQEDWKMAVMSGNEGQIASAVQKWIELLSSLGIVTPELLDTWKSDMLSFRTALLREILGEEADAALTKLEQDDQEHLSPHTNSYHFSLYAWRDWFGHFLNRVAETLSTHQAPENKTMAEIIKYIEHHYQSDLSLQEIARHFYVSREYISRKFKQELGDNFSDYLGKYRIDKAKLLMLNPNLKISQIAEMVGIHDVKYFSKVFKKIEGVSPKDYRSKVAIK
ncbi:response regulator [Paenibacillus puldeungensis]|uniref:Response regulator n=1 Tax=Paenibacillus puldeungensis TaxID=696536 RepID=A0ABW3RS78_9BACL